MMDDLTVKNNLEVAVLLSTYNGSCHIIEQLESLARQKYKNFRVYVRDDGSTDDTVQKLKEYEGLDLIIVDDSLGSWVIYAVNE
jgi:glycosyltransferase involved in cell wall biosynthesis